MAYLIVVGGISVNDPEEHDRYPYNFINPAIAKAKALKKGGVGGSDITVVFFAPPYEERVKKQVKEHAKVSPSHLPCSQAWSTWLCEKGFIDPPKDPSHFTNVARNSASGAGAPFAEIRSANDLTSLLNKAATIDSIYFYGHSNSKLMFLEYSVSVASSGTVTWGATEAAGVAKAKFAAGAKFVSYGCNQGDPGGLAQKLSESASWGIRCIASKGKTSFEPIGQGEAFPSSAGGWVAYTDGRLEPAAVDITTIL